MPARATTRKRRNGPIEDARKKYYSATFQKRVKAKAMRAISSAKRSGAFDYIPSEADVMRAYDNGAKTLKEALEMAGARINPARRHNFLGFGGSTPVETKKRKRKGSSMTAASATRAAYAAGKRLGDTWAFDSWAESKKLDGRGPWLREAFVHGVEGQRGNPAEQAIEGYEAFHGKEPAEFVTISRKVHFHKHLSGAGKLKKLVVLPVDGKKRVMLTRFGGALLAFNESRSQLFIEGGDQSVDLGVFGIDSPHELETLGQVKAIEYFTTKDHLGSEGGTATYVHKFRTTNEDGKHVTIRIARYPDLIYRVLDKQLEFSGGSYTILPEGIDR